MKTKTVSKSESIRQHLKTASDTSPKAVAEALKSKGVSVTPNLVSLIKFQAENGRAKVKARKRKLGGVRPKVKVKAKAKAKAKKFMVSEILKDARSSRQQTESVPVLGSLVAAKALLTKAGGLKNAHSLLDAVSVILS